MAFAGAMAIGESGADVALASESTDGETGQFKGCIPVNPPIFAVEEFSVGGKFVHQTKTCTNVVGNFAGDVEARPIRFAREVKHNGDIVLEREVEMADSDVA